MSEKINLMAEHMRVISNDPDADIIIVKIPVKEARRLLETLCFLDEKEVSDLKQILNWGIITAELSHKTTVKF